VAIATRERVQDEAATEFAFRFYVRAVALMSLRVAYKRKIGNVEAEAHAARVEAVRGRPSPLSHPAE
jgi:hypothetical protein